ALHRRAQARDPGCPVGRDRFQPADADGASGTLEVEEAASHSAVGCGGGIAAVAAPAGGHPLGVLQPEDREAAGADLLRPGLDPKEGGTLGSAAARPAP